MGNNLVPQNATKHRLSVYKLSTNGLFHSSQQSSYKSPVHRSPTCDAFHYFNLNPRRHRLTSRYIYSSDGELSSTHAKGHKHVSSVIINFTTPLLWGCTIDFLVCLLSFTDCICEERLQQPLGTSGCRGKALLSACDHC